MNADIHDAFLAADDWSRREYPDPAVFADESSQPAATPPRSTDEASARKPPQRTRPRPQAAAAPLASRRR